MTRRDRLLATAVAVIWGLNFPLTHLALEQFPPFLLVAVRFALLAVPAVLLVPRPDVPLRWLLGYGAGFGVVQFVGLYLGLAAGMPPGLASLVLQASAPFTVLLAVLLLGERLTRRRAAGLAVAVVGLAAIALHWAQLAALLPVLLTLLGALGWAFGNLASRLARPSHPLRLTLWMAVVPPLPAFALSWWLEGPDAIGTALGTVVSREAVPALVGLGYVVLVATVVGSGIWTTLLARNPSSEVAPFSMLVPVVGVVSSWLLLGERPVPVEVALGAVVIAGVVFASRPDPLRPAPSPPAPPAPAVAGPGGATSDDGEREPLSPAGR